MCIRDSPNEALQIHKDVKSKRSVGIHWGTFVLTTEPIKLGQVAEAKIISEAIVAIPFVQNEGRRSFFQLESDQILRHTRGKVALKDLAIGASIKQQIKLMKKPQQKTVLKRMRLRLRKTKKNKFLKIRTCENYCI